MLVARALPGPKTPRRKRHRTARNGAEALALYRRHSGEVSAVVTDMVMPVMDGVTLVRELRQIQPGVKVICVSGVGSRAKLPELDQVHPHAFLTKPFSTETLLRAVHEVIAAAAAPDHAKS
jgi:CheY-like chemotaxis protein